MTVNADHLAELSLVLLYSSAPLTNITMTDIAKNNWQIFQLALSPANPRQKGFERLWNDTFGDSSRPSDLPRLIDTVDHSTDKSMIYQWAITGPILITVVALRLWSRKVIMKKVLLSDWLIVLATISTVLYMIEFLMAQVYGGAGRHVWDVTLTELKLNYLLSFIAQVYYFTNAALVKFSLLVFYYGISQDRGYRLAVITVMVLTGVTTVLFTFLTLFGCRPIDWWDNPLVVDQKCLDVLAFTEAQGVISAVIDVVIFFLPSVVVVRLMMNMKEKIMVVGLFLLGVLAPISGVYRLVTLRNYSRGFDVTRLEIPPSQWTILEAQIGIICASVPALKVLVLHYYTIVTTQNDKSVSEMSTIRPQIMKQTTVDIEVRRIRPTPQLEKELPPNPPPAYCDYRDDLEMQLAASTSTTSLAPKRF